MLIRDFAHHDFESVVECYRHGFPEGHNSYTLARLVRWFEGPGSGKGSILVADDRGKIAGVIIGITTHWRAWLTALTVLPDLQYKTEMLPLKLIYALATRFAELGYTEAYATTGRRSVLMIAQVIGADVVREEPNFFFDGQSRWVLRADAQCFVRAGTYLQRFLG